MLLNTNIYLLESKIKVKIYLIYLLKYLHSVFVSYIIKVMKENNIKHNNICNSIVVKPAGPGCNMKCDYCYYLEKRRFFPIKSNLKMNIEMLELFIKDYIYLNINSVLYFIWQGGEPSILGLDYYKLIVKLQKKYAGDKEIKNIFQTNGTLITDDFCKFFYDNQFLLGVSIDGPEKYHNKYRKKNDGTGSFYSVMNCIELFKKYNVDFNTLTTVNNYNELVPLEIYNFLKNIGSNFIQFIPVVETNIYNKDGFSKKNNLKSRIENYSVSPDKYGLFLCSVFDEWVGNDVGNVYVQLFDVTLANWLGVPHDLCVFSETCGYSPVLEHNGNIYSCDHYVYPEYNLGNILKKPFSKIVNSEKQKIFISEKKKKLPVYCKDCIFKNVCYGGCPKNRFCYTPDNEYGLNYLCPSFRKFFNHTYPYMQFMANELKAKRPPANIMDCLDQIKTDVKL